MMNKVGKSKGVSLIKRIHFCDQIRDEIDKFKAQGVELEEQRQTILKNLEDKQTSSSKQADEFNEKYTGVMKIIDQLRAGKRSKLGNNITVKIISQ